MGIAFAGTGRYLPDYVVTNEMFAEFVDTSDEWIRTRTGMVERRISTGEPTWYLGEQAALQALDAAGLAPTDVDVLLCTTVTGDYQFPSTACMIQGALGATNAFAYDIAAACTGSVYALDMANRYLAAGDIGTVLLVSAESLSQTTDYTDRSTCVLFGDAAGAAVLKKGGGPFGKYLRSDPAGALHLYRKNKRRKLPFPDSAVLFEGEQFVDQEQDGLYMNGREVYKFATRAMPLAVREACADAGFAVEDLDLLIPHQANLRIIETAVKALGMPMEKVAVNIHKYGNTSSSTVMTCLDEAVREGQLKEGQRICLVGFGSGLTYGAVAMEYHR